MAINITTMTAADIDFAVSMTDAENWGYLRSDFERLLSLSPEGCFVAHGTLRRIGIITTSQHGDYGFMGTLIVMKNHRGSGIGQELFERAMMYLRSKCVTTIELDGVFPAADLYRRLGFRDKLLSLRFLRPAAPAKVTAPPNLSVSLNDLLQFDRKRIPVDRSAVLSRLYSDFSDSLMVTGDDKINGYAFVRPRASGVLAIGPLVADSPAQAAQLVQCILSRYSKSTLSIGVPDVQTDFVQTLLAAGFVFRIPSIRQYFGERRAIEEHVYGIISPEKG